MRFYLRIFLSGMLFCSFIFFSGCTEDPASTSGKQDPTGSKVKSDQADQMVENDMYNMVNGNYNSTAQLDNTKFQSALAMYNEALTLDTSNTNARFGAAIAEILSAYSDPEINKLIKEIDSAKFNNTTPNSISKAINTPLLFSYKESASLPLNIAAESITSVFKMALNDPPLISRIQQVIENNFLPKVNRAINHLSIIEANPNFKYSISGKMQGDLSLTPLSVYVTEAGLMNAGLNFLKFNLEFFLIYNFTLTDYKQATLLNALNQNNTDFYVLRSDGAQRGTAAKQTLLNIVTICRRAILNLQTVSGNKNDAIIKLSNTASEQKDIDSIKAYLTKFESALNGSFKVNIKNADSDGNSYDVTVNLGSFLTNPPQNPKKDLLPPYTVTASGTNSISFDFAATTYSDFAFPDPTFRGLFPDMTSDKLKRLMYLDEVFSYRLYGYVNIFGTGYNSWGMAANIPIKITANNVTYTAITDYYGNFKFMLKDAPAISQPITKYTMTYLGQEIELVAGNTLNVKSRNRDDCSIFYIMSPTNLVATRLTNPLRIGLTYNAYNTYNYKCLRKAGTSSFTEIGLSYEYYPYDYSDNNVTAGITYSYMLMPNYSNMYYYNGVQLIPKVIVPSNIVTITP